MQKRNRNLTLKNIDKKACPFYYRKNIVPMITKWSGFLSKQLRQKMTFCRTAVSGSSSPSSRWRSSRRCTPSECRTSSKNFGTSSTPSSSGQLSSYHSWHSPSGKEHSILGVRILYNGEEGGQNISFPKKHQKYTVFFHALLSLIDSLSMKFGFIENEE